MENDISAVKRRRGGQPGNRNARKNRPSFYCPEDSELLEQGYTVVIEGLDKAIALTRVKIRSLLADSSENYDLIYAATGTLGNLIRLKDRVIRNRNRIRSGQKV